MVQLVGKLYYILEQAAKCKFQHLWKSQKSLSSVLTTEIGTEIGTEIMRLLKGCLSTGTPPTFIIDNYIDFFGGGGAAEDMGMKPLFSLNFRGENS